MTRYTPEFEEFWQGYPKRYQKGLSVWVKRKKQPAFESWVKLDDTIHVEILSKLRFIKSSEGDSPRDAVTWLNQCGWEDIELPKPKFKPILPKQLTGEVLKDVPGLVNVNNERNRQTRALERSK